MHACTASPLFRESVTCWPTIGLVFANATISIPTVPVSGPVAIATLVGLLLGVARYRLGLGVKSAA